MTEKKDSIVYCAFKDFDATYRGKDKPDAPPLDVKNIKRYSLMMRRSVSFSRLNLHLSS